MTQKIRRPTLNPYEDRILLVLKRARRYLSTSQVSQFGGISYNTTRDYLKKLIRRGKVTYKKLSNKTMWKIK